MRKIRICIGSNDGEDIARTHMGDTECFLVYDLTADGQSVYVDQRNNTAKDLDHAQTDKMKQILALVKDADVLIAQQKSPNFVRIAKQTKYQPVVVEAETVQSVLELTLSHFDDIFALVECRRNGEFVDTIPELRL